MACIPALRASASISGRVPAVCDASSACAWKLHRKSFNPSTSGNTRRFAANAWIDASAASRRTRVIRSRELYFDFANGSATALPYPRINLFAAPPTLDGNLNDYDDWLRLLTFHEYAHIHRHVKGQLLAYRLTCIVDFNHVS